MFSYLSELSHFFGPLRIFEYVTFRSISAALTAFIITLWLAPIAIRLLTRLKLGQPIRGKEEVHQLADLHGSKKGTPTMGGLIVLVTLTISSLLWVKLESVYLWVVLIPTLLLGVLGFVDDYKKVKFKKSDGISSKQKLLGQVVIGLGVGIFLVLYPETHHFATSLQIPFLKNTAIYLGWFAVLFFIIVISGSSNAVNLTDGLDGLAIGCTVSVAVVFGLFAYLSGNKEFADYLLLPRVPGISELAIFCAALTGSSMGFLWYNCHPAKVFMGDTGSLAIGGALGLVAICVNQELLLVVVGGVFVMEALSVIIQVGFFKLTGKRVFAMSPIHHHFELKGWSETSVVVRFWILSIIFALIGLATLKLR
ncbi:MAG: phospho-N-acetylmuramoyl-pentapeptide-transferase [Blastochloris sp.]|jgi:phospho-N-acetylmuramoyl-pentapeptide-transferase|nr:phospho-N-acetylmuramoyl-pentapeptide-transferase [Blastochloris sp.]